MSDARPPIRLEHRDPAALAANPLNWKHHPAEQRAALGDLMDDVGWAGALLFNESTGLLIDGHERRDLAIARGETSVPVILGSWTPAQEKKILLYFDSIGVMFRTDATKLAGLVAAGPELLAGASQRLTQLYTDLKSTGERFDGVPRPTVPTGERAGPDIARPRPSVADVPDALWPSDNAYGVPVLDLALQADAVEFPVCVWGSQGQARAMRGTWVFYTADEAFSNLWANPGKPLASGAPVLCEPNYSTHDQTPLARSLWTLYQRRWIARYWQSAGRRIFVDCNVDQGLLSPSPALGGAVPAFLGVPRSWRAFATRAHGNRPGLLEAEYDAARAHSTALSLLFLVYGGGARVEQLAKDRGWVWIQEHERIRGNSNGREREHAGTGAVSGDEAHR